MSLVPPTKRIMKRALGECERDVDDRSDVLSERRRVVHAVVADVGGVRARHLEDPDVDAAELAELRARSRDEDASTQLRILGRGGQQPRAKRGKLRVDVLR